MSLESRISRLEEMVGQGELWDGTDSFDMFNHQHLPKEEWWETLTSGQRRAVLGYGMGGMILTIAGSRRDPPNQRDVERAAGWLEAAGLPMNASPAAIDCKMLEEALSAGFTDREVTWLQAQLAEMWRRGRQS